VNVHPENNDRVIYSSAVILVNSPPYSTLGMIRNAFATFLIQCKNVGNGSVFLQASQLTHCSQPIKQKVKPVAN